VTRIARAVVFASCLSAAFAGCATVKPYERERLSRRDMRLERDRDVGAGQEHATAYREGTTGAVGASGGGCGCN
jgi:hypothetical protein